METPTIILISILSTLSVVAIIALVVVAFVKQGRKIVKLEEDLRRSILKLEDETRIRTNRLMDDYTREFENVRKFIDSRCDKLDLKIKNSGTKIETQKQVLQG